MTNAGIIEVNGKKYMPDAKGSLVPLESISATDQLMDEMVRKVFGYAAPLSDEIARFKEHTFTDVDDFVALLDQNYGVKVGGKKGNITFTTFDGLMRIQVASADLIEFGPELQSAKALVDECLREWTQDSRAEIRAVIDRAFAVDQEGKIKRAELFSLMRLQIDDERWGRAMEAVRDSMRVVGSKRYVRFYRRARPDGDWRAVTLDLATA